MNILIELEINLHKMKHSFTLSQEYRCNNLISFENALLRGRAHVSRT